MSRAKQSYLGSLLWIGLLLLQWCQGGALAAPPNDNLSSATVLSGSSVSVGGSNNFATLEPNEPVRAGQRGGHSVWWRWTAPSSGGVTLDTAGSSFATVLAVYKGSSYASLAEVASNGMSNSTAHTSFKASANTTYQIAVDGVEGAVGSIMLTLDLNPAPANDDLANSVQMAANSIVTGSNRGATRESWETNLPGTDQSVWWKFDVAPGFEGTIFLDTTGSTFDTYLALYRQNGPIPGLIDWNDDNGYSLSSFLMLDLTNKSSLTVHYYVSVGGRDGTYGDIQLGFRSALRPGNDYFTNAAPIVAGSPLRGTLTAATMEASESSLPDGRSVWWKWLPAGGGLTATVRLNIDQPPGFDFEIYEGTGSSRLSDLVRVLPGTRLNYQGTQWLAQFVTETQKVYWVKVSGPQNSFGDFSLSVQATPSLRLVNDFFADAISISGSRYTNYASNLGATAEPNEPQHAGMPASRSLWWKWTAPSSGGASLYAQPGTRLAVYRGTVLSQLTLVAATRQTNFESGYSLNFNASKGLQYFVALDGDATGTPFSFRLALDASPGNDNQSQAIDLAGSHGANSSIDLTGTILGATRETNEPQGNDVRYLGHSVWYTWTAKFSGEANILIQATNFQPLLFVRSTTIPIPLNDSVTISDIPAVNRNFALVAFRATSNVTYEIRVDGIGEGGFGLRLRHFVRPANDDFENATALAGTNLLVHGSDLTASGQSGEPQHNGRLVNTSKNSLWWSWGNSNAGRVRLSFVGREAESTPRGGTFAVYTGETLQGLTLLSRSFEPGDSITFDATNSQAYKIAVDDLFERGPISFRLTEVLQPSNDIFSNRATLAGNHRSTDGSLYAATREPNEPGAAARTVWYSWNIPGRLGSPSGQATLTVAPEGRKPFGIQVYRGGLLSSLVEVPATTQCAGTSCQTTFDASPGVSHRIAVTGPLDLDESEGGFRLEWDFSTLTVRLFNLVESESHFSAQAEIWNHGDVLTHPLRIRLLGRAAYSVWPDAPPEMDVPAVAPTLPAAVAPGRLLVPISGALPHRPCAASGNPFWSLLAVLEEWVENGWYPQSTTIVLQRQVVECGDPTTGGVWGLVAPVQGSGTCVFDLKGVDVTAPAFVVGGSTRPFTGVAQFTNNCDLYVTTQAFSNTLWECDFAGCSFDTNGVMQIGSAGVDWKTNVQLTCHYSYAGVDHTVRKTTTVYNRQPRLSASRGSNTLVLQGIPGSNYLVQSSTKTTGFSNLFSTVMDASGRFQTNITFSGSQRFYRARE